MQNAAAPNLFVEPSRITLAEREQRVGQRALTIWFTGLSGAGKSTIAGRVERTLFDQGKRTFWLDGDNVRRGLNRDLGFAPEDRTENIRRIAEVSQLFNQAGIIVLAAFISPYRADRDAARTIIGEDRFLEVHIDAPLRVCEERDPKGLYRKAHAGELSDFTGVSAPYEAPLSPSLVVHTDTTPLADCVAAVVALITAHADREKPPGAAH